MAEKRDYYQFLGVDKSATVDDIKKAYRRKSIQMHPDNMRDKPADVMKAAEVEFSFLNEAKDILTDPTLRAAYDRNGHVGVENAKAGSAAGTAPMDTGFVPRPRENVEDFFARRSGDKKTEAPAAPQAPVDINSINLDEEGERERAAAQRRANRGKRGGGDDIPPAETLLQPPKAAPAPVVVSPYPALGAKVDALTQDFNRATNAQAPTAQEIEALRQKADNLLNAIKKSPKA